MQDALGDIACQKAQQASGLGRYGPARKCKKAYSKAVALEPTNINYLSDLAQFLAAAPGIVGGDRDSALALAATVRKVDEPGGVFLMAEVLRHGNDKDKSRADSLVEGLAGPAADRATLFRMAGYWASTGHVDKALAIDERLIAADPSDLVAQFGVGRNLVVLKQDPRRAQTHLRLAETAPAPAPEKGKPGVSPGAVDWRLGQAYVQLGITDSARIMFERALQTNPKLTPAKASLDSLGKR